MVYVTFEDGQSHTRVDLAGEFTDWKPVPMTTSDGKVFQRWETLHKGDYMYKFIVDGEWRLLDLREIGKLAIRNSIGRPS